MTIETLGWVAAIVAMVVIGTWCVLRPQRRRSSK